MTLSYTPPSQLIAAEFPTSIAPINSVGTYVILAIVCALAAVCAVGIPFALAHRTPREKKVSRHSVKRTPETWRKQVTEIVEAFHKNELTESEAYAGLARISREFASVRLGTDFTAKTLMDLNVHHQVGGKAHFDLLKQTISALYPAEFADSSTNAQASETSVDTAAEWVDSMIERWVS
ncbi:MAG: hypothetical protein LKJ44_03870 [Bifidobacteriaceae bacterium]|jgi:hypothetical protein|nr:hypothetical protein [Bifidobacteriaceae bacterium]MCI1978836.1 hypothetical protein [Bifidobacteriaceae bacterium]